MAGPLGRWPLPLLLGDGALGTYLLPSRRQVSAAPPATLCLTAPERVLQAHRAYRAAGAQVVQTNSFGADRLALAGTAWAGRTGEIARAAVALAREAAEDALVAGSVAGLAQPPGWAAAHPQAAQSAYAELVDALLAAGVDMLLLETMSDLASAEVAVAAARAAAGAVPVVCTIAVGSGLAMACGCGVQAAAVRLREAGADAVGVNCGDGPATALAAGRAMRAAVPELALALQPSAGLPDEGDTPAWPLTPAGFAAFAAAARQLGAVLIGGCCGTTPPHIGAAAAATGPVS